MMDLDELKNNWKNYDTMLEEHLILDQNALRKRNLDKSQDALFKPYAHEISNVIVVLLTTVFVLNSSLNHLDELHFSVPGLIGVFLGSLHIYFSIVKAWKISRLDFELPIINIQKKISRLTILIFRLQKFEVLILPFFIISVLPITFWVIQNRDLYTHWGFFVFSATFIIGFSLLGMRWVHRHLYDQKIKQVQSLLAEIIELENPNG